ncbi:MAG: MFS transporter [Gemmatimonadaceae bacterium]|nr:MFS transporter [Gemmatimonadaceae bacterium]MCC6431238.1 MFS transporter [Gemmatimonadaceae bacterium]
MTARTIDAVGSTHDAVFRKVGARVLPLLFVCYIVAYLDRVNVGFAKLQMTAALSLSDAAYGFGAGIFFIGYFLFEVPSNLILQRVGARVWIARIMITWGVVSAAFAFVAHIPWGPLPALFGVPPVEFSFYALRMVLGLAEAGFFPGIILYLTYWYPSARRARAVAMFMTAIAVANVVGAPLSGAIMQFADGTAGWEGWQWLFVLEALPSVVLGFVIWRVLPDGPSSAQWLTADERAVVEQEIADDRARLAGASVAQTSALAAFANWRVWAMAFVYLTGTFAMYGVNFWMPTIIQELGIAKNDFLKVGLVTMIPWGVAGVAMVWYGAHSDRTGERRWHASGALLLTAAGLALLAVAGHAAVMSVVALTLIASGVLGFLVTFWAVPTALLRASAAAAGIAWINSVGNLGGHFGPDLIGRIREATDAATDAFWALALIAVSGALMMLMATTRVRT